MDPLACSMLPAKYFSPVDKCEQRLTQRDGGGTSQRCVVAQATNPVWCEPRWMPSRPYGTVFLQCSLNSDLV